jgi:hypothetical protein
MGGGVQRAGKGVDGTQRTTLRHVHLPSRERRALLLTSPSVTGVQGSPTSSTISLKCCPSGPTAATCSCCEPATKSAGASNVQVTDVSGGTVRVLLPPLLLLGCGSCVLESAGWQCRVTGPPPDWESPDSACRVMLRVTHSWASVLLIATLYVVPGRSSTYSNAPA